MMRIEELSIGDWVRYRDADANVRVNAIYSDGYVFIVGEEDSGISENLNAHHYLEPIPLTPEILEKNGWLPPRKAIEFDTWWWTNGVDKAIEAYEYEGEWYLTIIEQKEIQYRNRVGIGLKYVHQLQHALRLVGVEKEIEV